MILAHYLLLSFSLSGRNYSGSGGKAAPPEKDGGRKLFSVRVWLELHDCSACGRSGAEREHARFFVMTGVTSRAHVAELASGRSLPAVIPSGSRLKKYIKRKEK